MFSNWYKKIYKHVWQSYVGWMREYLYTGLMHKYVGWMVRKGKLPYGILQGEVVEALKTTRPKGVVEVFGMLRVRVKRAATGLWEDYGLVSTKLVTVAFAEFVVDALQDSTTYALDLFTWHDMGDDNTAEANTHTALQNSRESRVNDTSPGENTSQVYQSIATITATGGYTAQEHGIFNDAVANTMMDRNLIPNAPVLITDDQVEFTYELTVNAEA